MRIQSQKTLVLATIALDKMAGGLEKNIINLANAMSQKGYDVHLITFDYEDAAAFYPIHDDVKWHKMAVSEPHKKISFSKRLKLLGNVRDILKTKAKGAPVICFHHGLMLRFLFSSAFLGNPIICSERNALALYKFVKKRKWNLNFLAMGLAKKITVQFPSYIKDYPLPLRHKIVAISNPVFPSDYKADVTKPDQNGRFTLACTSRFSHQKNLGVLIDAFAKLAEDHPDWDLKIAGDGEEEKLIKDKIKNHQLENRISLVGKTENVGAFLSKAHLFCIPSLWEGFPNALAEALACSLPSVGFENCAGVRDLIQNGRNGFLAQGSKDPESLKNALQALMNDSERRAEMSREAVKICDIYKPALIYDLWDDLVKSVSAQGK